MSARPTWKGVLKISLVTIPIKVFPATESSDSLSFNQIHGECQSRVTQRKWCTNCGREVQTSEIVKGFEFATGRYVILSDADFAKVRPASTRVIDLVQFAAAAALDPMYVDRTYYLAPDGTGAQAFAVMCEGMKGKVGIGKLAIYGREYLVAVRPWTKYLLLHTLHHAAEIRPAIEELHDPPVVVAFSQIRLARQVIAAFTGPLDLADFQDDYKAGLQEVIDAKIAGQEIVVPAVETLPVVNLREALTQSLAAVSATKKKPARINTDGTKRKRRA